MRRGRRTAGPVSIAVAVGLVVTACSSSWLAGGSSASCAAHEIELAGTGTELVAGGTVQLAVDHLWQTCEDTGGTSRPAEDVVVTIVPSSTGDEVVLGRPSPSGPTGRVSGSFGLPADLPVGPAVLSVRSLGGDQASATLDVTVGAPATSS